MKKLFPALFALLFVSSQTIASADEGISDRLAPVKTQSSAPSSIEERLRLLEEKLAKSDRLEQKVAVLEKENQELKSKVGALEEQLTVKVRPPAASVPPAEKPKTVLDTVKLKGRFAAGFLKQANGNQAYSTQPAYSHGSFEVPEAKVQVSVSPDDKNSVVMRANLNNATWNSLDVFCLESKVGTLLPNYEDLPFTVESRFGRFKMLYGEEEATNNMVESATGDNSASNAVGYDEGLQFFGNLGKEKPVKYWLSVTNGPGTGSSTGTTRDNYFPKAFTGRLGYQLLDPLYVSTSVYTSGGLGAQASDMPFAGLTATPTGIPSDGGWKRTLWETDARYDIGKGKNTSGGMSGAYCDSTAYLRGAFGQLYDSVDNLRAPDRNANYGYIEGLWNFHPKFYGAARYSLIDMMGGNCATLNNLNFVEEYQRYSFGVGYRWTDKTIIRVAYEINSATLDSTRTWVTDANDDLLMVTLGTLF